MIAVDSSTLISLLQGEKGRDVDFLSAALRAHTVRLPLAALTEVLSDPKLPPHHRNVVIDMPRLPITDEDYWIRAAATRSVLLARKLRAFLPDTLIAQSCIDHDVPLITNDPDFEHFATHCGLKLA